MDDEYDFRRIQQQGRTKVSKDDIDLEIEQRRAAIEEENYSMVVESRRRIQEGALKQKKTTAELRRQGEKLRKISSDAESVYGNAKSGREMTQKIKDEGSLFRFPHVFRNIKRFFSADRRTEAGLDAEIRDRKKGGGSLNEEELQFEKDAPDTEENMRLLIGDLRRMRNEAGVQKEEIQRQNLKIQRINRINKQSSRIMERTNEELRRI